METTTKAFVNTEVDYALDQIMGQIDSTKHVVLIGDTSAAEKERIEYHLAHMKDTIKCLMRHIKENVETGVLPPFRTMSWEDNNSSLTGVMDEPNPAPAAAGASTPRPEEGALPILAPAPAYYPSDDGAASHALWGSPGAFPYHIPREPPPAPRAERYVLHPNPYGGAWGRELTFDK
jgi:hypothetical protein